MKKLLAVLPLAFVLNSPAHATMTYECYAYVDGEPTGGFVKVSADSKSEAEIKAMKKYKEIKVKADYVNCH